MIPKTLANMIVVLVSLVWAANFVAAVFAPDYQPDTSINFVFMTIVGGALALRRGEGPNVAQRVARALSSNEPLPPPPPVPPTPPTDES